LLIFSCR